MGTARHFQDQQRNQDMKEETPTDCPSSHVAGSHPLQNLSGHLQAFAGPEINE